MQARVSALQYSCLSLEHGGTHDIGDVADAIEAGHAQLWTTDGAALVTEVLEHPRAKVLHIWLAAGELEPVIALAEQTMEWGRLNGCTRVTLTGRKGWERVGKARGWEFDSLTMGKAL